MAQDKQTVGQGVRLLFVYSAGLALPFIILAALINYLLAFTRKAAKVVRFANPVAGVLLIATGILLITNKLAWLAF
jgi:cytochrome c-type biogenesis protein